MNTNTPVIAIVGRPNVGKSTLFNRLVGYRKAIVDGTPGVTRDRNFHVAAINNQRAYLIDTGGFEPVAKDNLRGQILEQTMLAIEEADLTILVCDGREGLNPADTEVAQILRTSGKQTILVINKIDEPTHEARLNDFYPLGFREIIPVSAEHNLGMGDLEDRITSNLSYKKTEGESGNEELIKVSIIGKPNTGKSSLINKILGTNRTIVNATAGTTRDCIDTVVNAGGKDYILIDTAGIRKKTRVSQKLEKYSVIMALKSLERSNVLVLMIDASEGVGAQDVKIAAQAYEMGKACIIAVNKWDLVEKETNTLKDFTFMVRDKIKFMPFAPVVSISALTGKRIEKLFPIIDRVYENHCFRIQTSEVTKIFESAIGKKPLPVCHGKPGRMFFATQTGVRPPVFVCFVNRAEGIPLSYHRYMEKQIREKFPFEGTPIRIVFKTRERE